MCVKTTDLDFKVHTPLQTVMSAALSVLYVSNTKARGTHGNKVYLPRCCIASEVGKHSREPIVDFI